MVTRPNGKMQEMPYRIQVAVSLKSRSDSCDATASPKYDVWRGFDTYCEQLAAAKRRVADWYTSGIDRGEALVLAGPPGTGKTHLAVVVLNAYGGSCASSGAFMIGEADLLANVRASYSGDGCTEKMILAQYRRVPLFILDDVGAAYVKAGSRAWLEDIYWRILDRRFEMCLPILLTTNMDLERLACRLGARAFSRLAGMMGDDRNYVSLFGVPDYRQRGWSVK